MSSWTLALVVVAYVLAGTATATEVAMWMERQQGKRDIGWQPDGEDVLAIFGAFVIWPLIVVAAGWVAFRAWLKNRESA